MELRLQGYKNMISDKSHSKKFLQACLCVTRAIQGEKSTSQSVDGLGKTVSIVQVTCNTVSIVQVTWQDSEHCSGDL